MHQGSSNSRRMIRLEVASKVNVLELTFTVEINGVKGIRLISSRVSRQLMKNSIKGMLSLRGRHRSNSTRRMIRGEAQTGVRQGTLIIVISRGKNTFIPIRMKTFLRAFMRLGKKVKSNTRSHLLRIGRKKNNRDRQTFSKTFIRGHFLQNSFSK